MMTPRLALRLLLVLPLAAVLTSCLNTNEPEVTSFPVPAEVIGSHKFTTVTGGDFHTCALDAGGHAFCWGVNTQGQSGNGLNSNSGASTPLAVLGGYVFDSIYAGGSHSCGLQADGTGLCWGNNAGGQLGDGTRVSEFVPVPIVGNHKWRMLTTSTLAHTCGIATDGQTYCWGLNQFGLLGDGSDGTSHDSPTLVTGGIAFKNIAAGAYHTCGVATNGDAYCWGAGLHGALGNGVNTDRNVPTLVSGGLKFVSLSAGVGHTCGLTDTSEAYCWGYNIVGSVGDGSTSDAFTPTAVAGAHQFTSIVTGERHNCGITVGGETLCWGYNITGALGDGTLVSKPAPVSLVSSLLFVKLAAGGYHTCGITASGTTYCWGDNSGRQLGTDE